MWILFIWQVVVSCADPYEPNNSSARVTYFFGFNVSSSQDSIGQLQKDKKQLQNQIEEIKNEIGEMRKGHDVR